ncbi:16208_t:CDS:2 [Acaulospora morrowiae]|uniref:16208_t:CDS:1 n=1 Tax=Acaulospora morrowiae TaxID=94023 RepID=A0A9N9GXW3_9GLOM|nr:16208_t:CDS:2 [Acaulospora morrowiae]
MTRGSSLEDDFRAIIDDHTLSDLRIKCSDKVIIRGCRIILAARSDYFNSLLYGKMREAGQDEIELPKIDSKTMRIILEYIYTGGLDNPIESTSALNDLIEAYSAAEYLQLQGLKNDILLDFQEATNKAPEETFSPELLSSAIEKLSPTADPNPLTDVLAEGVSKMRLEGIPFEKFSTLALMYLVRYCKERDKPLAKNQYNLFRYITLHTASKVSQEALERFEYCLPPLEKTNVSVYPERLEDLKSVQLENTELHRILEHVDFTSINGKILVDIIEPLEVVPYKILLGAYRHKAKNEVVLEEKKVLMEFTWDRNFCGPNLVSASSDIRYNERVRAIQPIESGIHNWDVIIEAPSTSDWVGVCGEGDVINFSCDDYNSKVWILGSTGHVSNNAQQRPYGTPPFGRNTKVTVHLNMYDRSLAFSVNDVRYQSVLEWKNLPSKVYPLVSMRHNGRFRIHSNN